MAPKQKITRDQIVEGAFSFVRENGADALKARELSQYLHCSTQPIFSNFSGMSELRQCVIRSAIALCDRFLQTDKTGLEASLEMGIGYLRFANEERNLFRLLFLNSRDEMKSIGINCSEYKTQEIMRRILGEADEKTSLLHLEMWVSVHGIASMLSTGYINWEDGKFKKVLSDIFYALTDRYGNPGES